MIISENKDLPDPHHEHHDLEDHFVFAEDKGILGSARYTNSHEIINISTAKL